MTQIEEFNNLNKTIKIFDRVFKVVQPISKKVEGGNKFLCKKKTEELSRITSKMKIKQRSQMNSFLRVTKGIRRRFNIN